MRAQQLAGGSEESVSLDTSLTGGGPSVSLAATQTGNINNPSD